jgi:hypothetical protein
MPRPYGLRVKGRYGVYPLEGNHIGLPLHPRVTRRIADFLTRLVNGIQNPIPKTQTQSLGQNRILGFLAKRPFA